MKAGKYEPTQRNGPNHSAETAVQNVECFRWPLPGLAIVCRVQDVNHGGAANKGSSPEEGCNALQIKNYKKSTVKAHFNRPAYPVHPNFRAFRLMQEQPQGHGQEIGLAANPWCVVAVKEIVNGDP